MSFGFDPEVPAGFQDADIEMAELREQADRGFCPKCYGDGTVIDRSEIRSKWKNCPLCGGTGVIE